MSVKHIDYLKLEASRFLTVEVRPIKCSINTPSGQTKTAKWMTYEHWKELRILLNEIADQYEEDKRILQVTQDIKCNEHKMKDGKLIKIGYMFVPNHSCSCHFLVPRDDATWTDDEDDMDESHAGQLKDKGGRYKNLMPVGERLVVSVRLQEDKGRSLRGLKEPKSPVAADKQLVKALDRTIEITNTISDYFASESQDSLEIKTEDDHPKYYEDDSQDYTLKRRININLPNFSSPIMEESDIKMQTNDGIETLDSQMKQEVTDVVIKNEDISLSSEWNDNENTCDDFFLSQSNYESSISMVSDRDYNSHDVSDDKSNTYSHLHNISGDMVKEGNTKLKDKDFSGNHLLKDDDFSVHTDEGSLSKVNVKEERNEVITKRVSDELNNQIDIMSSLSYLSPSSSSEVHNFSILEEKENHEINRETANEVNSAIKETDSLSYLCSYTSNALLDSSNWQRHDGEQLSDVTKVRHKQANQHIFDKCDTKYNESQFVEKKANSNTVLSSTDTETEVKKKKMTSKEKKLSMLFGDSSDELENGDVFQKVVTSRQANVNSSYIEEEYKPTRIGENTLEYIPSPLNCSSDTNLSNVSELKVSKKENDSCRRSSRLKSKDKLNYNSLVNYTLLDDFCKSSDNKKVLPIISSSLAYRKAKRDLEATIKEYREDELSTKSLSVENNDDEMHGESYEEKEEDKKEEPVKNSLLALLNSSQEDFDMRHRTQHRKRKGIGASKRKDHILPSEYKRGQTNEQQVSGGTIKRYKQNSKRRKLPSNQPTLEECLNSESSKSSKVLESKAKNSMLTRSKYNSDQDLFESDNDAQYNFNNTDQNSGMDKDDDDLPNLRNFDSPYQTTDQKCEMDSDDEDLPNLGFDSSYPTADQICEMDSDEDELPNLGVFDSESQPLTNDDDPTYKVINSQDEILKCKLKRLKKKASNNTLRKKKCLKNVLYFKDSCEISSNNCAAPFTTSDNSFVNFVTPKRNNKSKYFDKDVSLNSSQKKIKSKDEIDVFELHEQLKQISEKDLKAKLNDTHQYFKDIINGKVKNVFHNNFIKDNGLNDKWVKLVGPFHMKQIEYVFEVLFLTYREEVSTVFNGKFNINDYIGKVLTPTFFIQLVKEYKSVSLNSAERYLVKIYREKTSLVSERKFMLDVFSNENSHLKSPVDDSQMDSELPILGYNNMKSELSSSIKSPNNNSFHSRASAHSPTIDYGDDMNTSQNTDYIDGTPHLMSSLRKNVSLNACKGSPSKLKTNIRRDYHKCKGKSKNKTSLSQVSSKDNGISRSHCDDDDKMSSSIKPMNESQFNQSVMVIEEIREYDLEKLKILKQKLASISEKELEKKIIKFKHYLESIIFDKTDNSRHKIFKLNNLQCKRAIHDLVHIYSTFEENQITFVMNFLKKTYSEIVGNIFHSSRITQYVYKVLTPSFFIKLVMDLYNVDEQKGENLLDRICQKVD